MSSKSVIVSHANGKKFHTPSANCKSKMAVYAAECCICFIQYVGRIVQEIRTRGCGHRSWMYKCKTDARTKDDDDEAILAEHLKTAHNIFSTDGFDNSYQFTVLQLCEPDTLVYAEYKWIMDLKTLTPFGLNISKPYGISEKLM